MGQGHLGDLPVLIVGADGAANQTLYVTRLHSPSEFKGHALVIHANGDNYSDLPAPLGGGGARLACGVVQ
jgi:Cu-Zn family superoxide dismutase